MSNKYHRENASRILDLSFIFTLSLVVFGFYLSSPEEYEAKAARAVDKPDKLIVLNYAEEKKPPPPPKKPQIPVEAKDNEDIDELTIEDSEPYKENKYEEPPEELDPVVDINSLTNKPKIIKRFAAVYPERAIKAGAEALVVVELIADKNGKPTNIKILKGHPLFNDAAIAAISQYRFQAGMQRGKTVRVKWHIPLRFKLKN